MPTDSQRPFVSVVIPTRNRLKYLQRSLPSVVEEKRKHYPDMEVIVVDGGSTDGTREYLEEFGPGLDRWISEPDRGVSDAGNKGIALARGDVLRFLGDDDELIHGWFSPVMEYLRSSPDVGVVLCQAEVYRERADGSTFPENVVHPVGSVGFANMLTLGSKSFGWPSPEVAFTRREVFLRHGGFDLTFRYLGFWEIWLRQLRAGVRLEALAHKIARRYLTPSSDSSTGTRAMRTEYTAIRWMYGGPKALLVANRRWEFGAVSYLKHAFWTTVTLPKGLRLARSPRRTEIDLAAFDNSAQGSCARVFPQANRTT